MINILIKVRVGLKLVGEWLIGVTSHLAHGESVFVNATPRGVTGVPCRHPVVVESSILGSGGVLAPLLGG